MHSGGFEHGGGRRGPARTLLWQLVREQRRYLAGAILVSAVAFGVQIALGQAAKAVIDEGLDARSQPLEGLVVRMGVLGVAHVTMALIGVLLMTRVRWQIEYRVRTVLHRSLVSEEVASGDLSTGQVVTRAVADLGQLNNVVYILPIFIAGVPAVLSGMAYLGYLNFPLMLVTFSSLPINFWLVRRMRPRVQALSWLQLQETAEITRAIDEPIRGIRVVKLFGKERDVARGVRDAARRAYRYALTRTRVLAGYSALLRVAPALSQAALLLLGARAINAGSFTSGEFLVFFVGSAQVTYFAQSFSAILDQWTYAKVGSSRIGQLVDPSGQSVGDRMVVDDQGRAEVDVFGPPRLGWACRDLVFDDGHAVTVPLSFTVAPGEVALVQGPSSLSLAAVAEILCGDLAPTRGEVWLEDQSLHDLPSVDARTHLRILDSEPYLFARSVRDNLVLGAASDVDEPARIERALWAACADEVVATLPEGLDEVLGDRAMNLSGGQRQRLALARALFAEPRLLLLVEALSGVHAEMEGEILRRIASVAPSMSILYLTSRPSAASAVDKVMTIRPDEADRGPVTGSGGPDGAAAQRAERAEQRDLDLAKHLSVAEVVDEQPRCAPSAEEVGEAPTVGNLARSFRSLLPSLTLVVTMLALVTVAPQYLFGLTNDAIEAGTGDTDRFALALVSLTFVGALGHWWFDINAARLSNGMLYLLRTRLIRRLARLGLAYYDRELPGYVATRVLHDLEEVTIFARAIATRLIVTLLTLLAASLAMALVGAQIVLLIVGIIATAVVATAIQVPIARRAYLRQRAALGDVIARLEEDYNGRGAIAEADAVSHASRSFEVIAERLRRADRWSACVSAFYVMAIQWIAEIGGALIMWRSGVLVLGGALSLGSMLTVRLLLQQVLLPIMELGNMWQQYLRARVSFDRLRQPYDAGVLPVDRDDAAPCPALVGDIVFDGVGFRYPGTEREIFRETSLRLPAGKTIAVMGPTGAGKSTIGKLVARVYDPDAGRVLVGDDDLRDFTTASLRHRIGVVPQEPFLFAGTVATNIAFGRPDANLQEIQAAVDAVGAGPVLARLDGGLDAPVIEEGINLTPQQRQLVALARAWMMHPDVLVLDEATSALDDRTELRVLQSLRQREGTTIFVTHREAVADAADLVLLVDGGVTLVEDRREPAGTAAAPGTAAG